MTLFRLAAPLAFALAAAGCNQTAQSPAPAAPASTVTPAGFRLPEGSGCAADIARWRAIQENDRRMGHVGARVYETIRGEIAEAEAACAAGRDAEASALVAASRKRHGYPG